MTNKQVIEKLVEYFLTQDPALIADMCANAFIDLNKFLNLKKLKYEDQKDLVWRTQNNCDQLFEIAQSNQDPKEMSSINLVCSPKCDDTECKIATS